MEKVAGYIRVSSQEQKLHGYSLDAQKMKTDTLNDLSHTRTPKDYSYIDNILNDDWEVVYNGLTDEYKKAFWHQFISEIILTFNNGHYDVQRIKFL